MTTEVLNEDCQLHSAPTSPDMNEVNCSICAAEIDDHVQEYFCGEPFDPVCDNCKADANLDDIGLTPDAFSSFPTSEMPVSLVAHWTAPDQLCSRHDVLMLPSFRAHFVQAPNPGDYFISIMMEMMQEISAKMEKQERMLEDRCQTS